MQKFSRYIDNVNKALILLLISFSSAYSASNDPLANLVKPKQVPGQLKSSPLFEGRGDGITTCPVTGEKITIKKFKAEIYGRTIYFCCHGCLKSGLKMRDKFVKPSQAEQLKAVRAFLAKAQAVNSEEFCNE